MVQAVCSGLVAGKMGSRSVRDGAKHVAVMLGTAYAVFLAVRMRKVAVPRRSEELSADTCRPAEPGD